MYPCFSNNTRGDIWRGCFEVCCNWKINKKISFHLMCVQFVHVLFILPNFFCLFVVQSLLMFARMHNGHIFSRILVFMGKKLYHFKSQQSQPRLAMLNLDKERSIYFFFVCDFVECFSKLLNQGSSFYVASKSPSWKCGCVMIDQPTILGY
jgi:hypothetical protein